MQTAVELNNQWNDFLLRSVDPYASAKYDVLLEWLGDLSGKKALVVGSGSGEFAALLVKSGAQVKAVDIDAASVELTKKTAQFFGVELETEVATLEALPLTQQYDVVVATDVIEHIQDDRAAAKKLTQLTRPGGKVVITVPAGPTLFGYHDEVLGHFRRYTKESLDELFRDYIRIEKLRYYGLFLIPVALVISRWLRKPYPVAQVGAAERGKGLMGSVVRGAFSWEKRLSPPKGTSLLLLGRV